MSGLLAPEHVLAILAIAGGAAVTTIAARRSPGPWLRVFAVVIVIDEVSWWLYLFAGGVPGAELAQSLPLQLCDVAVFIAAAALWSRNQLLVEVTYLWGLAGTLQAILTPDLPQHFPSYPYFQYYIAHGGVVAAAVLLVVGMRLHPRRWAVARVAALTIAYSALVGVVDAITQANYLYLRAKPPSATLLDLLGPWPVYILAATVIGIVLFAILDAPFRIRLCREMAEPPRPPRIERRISSPQHRLDYQKAKDAPTEHKPRLITSRSVAGQVHGGGAIGRLNTALAVTVTKSVGTMWAAYVFTLIAVGGAVAVITNSAFWTAVSVLISQTFLQLVLLPIIIVGQNVISEAQDARAEADHLTLTTLHAINVQQLEIIKQSREMLKQQHDILDMLQRKGQLPMSSPGPGA